MKQIEELLDKLREHYKASHECGNTALHEITPFTSIEINGVTVDARAERNGYRVIARHGYPGSTYPTLLDSFNHAMEEKAQFKIELERRVQERIVSYHPKSKDSNHSI